MTWAMTLAVLGEGSLALDDASTFSGRPRPTLRDLAREAGVSEITASRALRGEAHVLPETTARVQEAARKLGYVRNRLAGSLAGGPSNQVGVVLPSLANVVFPDVLKGLEEVLEEAGFHPVLGISNYDPDREEHLLEALLAWRPAAIVLASAGLSERGIALLRSANLPVVEIMDVDVEPIDMAVGISQTASGRAMAYYLSGRGYRRFAYVGHDIARDRRAGRRFEGFRSALAECGHALAGEMILQEPSSVTLGRTGTERLLAAMPERPDVIYYSNDDLAVGGMYHCIGTGLSVPADVALAGFNGLEIGQALPVPLTTISSGRHEIGRRAADQILRRLRGETVERKVDVGFTLLAGASA